MTKKERLEKLRGMGPLGKEVAEMSEKLDKIFRAMGPLGREVADMSQSLDKILAAMPKKKATAKKK
jgi:uncharacterized membrane protein